MVLMVICFWMRDEKERALVGVYVVGGRADVLGYGEANECFGHGYWWRVWSLWWCDTFAISR